MKKLASLAVIVVMCLVLVGVGSAATTPKEKNEVKKCTYPAGTTIGVEIVQATGNGESVVVGYVNLLIVKKLTITVLEEVMVPVVLEDGSESTMKMYRFSGAYDQPVIFCPTHIQHTYDEYGANIPSDRYMAPAAEGQCSK